MHTIIIDDG